MPAIRAALFDLANTLVSYYQPTEFIPILRKSLDACQRALGMERLGHEANTALLHRALDLNQERADLAVWPLEQRLRVLFRDRLPDPTMLERLSRAFLEPIFATARVDQDALDVLTTLKRQGIKTAVVSNTPWGSCGRAWRSELARHDLLPALNAVVFCTDVGWRKPHPMPFRRALELLDVSAQEAVVVGDDPAWDIEGARSASLVPILVGSRHDQSTSETVIRAASLRDVLSQIDRLSAPANAGPQPALA